jgi:hypothetical protein
MTLKKSQHCLRQYLFILEYLHHLRIMFFTGAEFPLREEDETAFPADVPRMGSCLPVMLILNILCAGMTNGFPPVLE